METMDSAGTLKTIRCISCDKIIGEVHGEYRLWCRKCKAWTVGNTKSGKQYLIRKEKPNE